MIICSGIQWGGKKLDHTSIVFAEGECPLCTTLIILDGYKRTLKAKVQKSNRPSPHPSV